MRIFPAPPHTDADGGWRFDPRRRSYLWSDCHGSSSTSNLCGDWMVSWSGAAANPNFSASLGSSSPNGEGIVLLPTGSTSTGRCALITSSFERLCLGTARVEFEARLHVSTLSTNTETHIVNIGVMDSVTTSAIADGVYFSAPAHGLTNWTCTTVAGGTATTSDSGAPCVAGTYHILRIEINETGTRADFLIDGVCRATHTTNIPSGFAQRTGAAVAIRKTVGTSSRYLAVDYALLTWDVSR